MMWATLVVAAMGVVLFIRGMRGRRIDDHPLCRRCRFDLIGLLPARSAAEIPPSAAGRVCPECGANLAARAAVRTGHRRRGRAGIAIGVVLMIGAGAVGGIIGYGAATGFSWNTVKPASWLKREVLSGDSAVSLAAARELMSRVQGGAADPLVASVVVETTLSKQLLARQYLDSLRLTKQMDYYVDPRPGLDPWLALFDAAVASGGVTPEQAVRYIRQGQRISAEVRTRVAAGSKMPINQDGGYDMGVMSYNYPVLSGGRLVSCKAGDRAIPFEFENWCMRAQVDLPPGDYTLELTFEVVAFMSTNRREPVGSFLHVQRTPLRVEPAGTEIVKVSNDDGLAARIAARIVTAVIEDDLDPKMLAVSLELDRMPAALVASSWLEHGGRKWPIGIDDSHDYMSGPLHLNGITELPPDLPLEEEFTLVLKPDLRRAVEATTLVEIWGREIRVGGVRLKLRSRMNAGESE